MYYVVLPDGRKFGPADVDTLNGWIRDGRVGPESLLEDEGSGLQYRAREIEGLTVFSGAPPPTQSPTESGFQPHIDEKFARPPQAFSSQYPRDGGAPGDAGKAEVAWSFVCGGAGIVVCCCFPISVVGIVLGHKAKSLGHPSAQAAIIVSWVTLVIGFLYWVASFVMAFTMPGANPFLGR